MNKNPAGDGGILAKKHSLSIFCELKRPNGCIDSLLLWLVVWLIASSHYPCDQCNSWKKTHIDFNLPILAVGYCRHRGPAHPSRCRPAGDRVIADSRMAAAIHKGHPWHYPRAGENRRKIA
jgi:hypothetical protein